MRKPTINYGWPVKFTNFSEEDNKLEKFSRGKLEVFYKGETEDHRFFSDAFSKNLVQTLPYTPIVSYYDEEKDDFVGHATEQQILGIVDPCREISFKVDEDGREWCVCDVVLYTERPDKVGSIAKKIIGHKQSLELDPKTTEYVINYDEKKHFKNIEFTAGSFVGVSVLGNDQRPAFTGSHFFTCDEQFESKMKLLRDFCEREKDQETHIGGKQMNLQEFMKLSWGDISLKVEEEICREYAEDAFVSVIDMFEDSAIVRFFYFVEGTNKLMRIHYSLSPENKVILGKINEVHITYEDIEELPKEEKEIDMTQATEKVTDAGEVKGEEDTPEFSSDKDDSKEEPKKEEDKTDSQPEGSENDVEEKKEKEEDLSSKKDQDDENADDEDNEEDEDKDSSKYSSNNSENSDFSEETPAHVDNVKITTEDSTDTKVSVDNETKSLEEENASSTSFTNSERAELEALKREKKIALVDSYKDQISEEDFTSFSSKVDEFEIQDLELALLKAYKRNQEENAANQKPMRAFTLAQTKNVNSENNSLDSFVRKNLRK